MICFVLAGGSSDRLWPLSRRDFPKQFMTIRKGYSIFQETVLRNIPFCDRFVILTNKRYDKVVNGQLRAFQGIDYSVVLEESILKTAPSVIACALNEDPNEELLIVSTDNLIDGEYNQCITEVKKVVRDNKIALVVTDALNNDAGYHYIDEVKGKIRFSQKRTKNSYWDCGIFGCKISVLLDSVNPQLLDSYKRIQFKDNVIEKEQTRDILPESLSRALDKGEFQLVKAMFNWQRITDISSYHNFTKDTDASNIVTYNCKSVDVVNTIPDQLVVTNGLKNVVVVNTRDAIYVSAKGREPENKNIMDEYYPLKRKFFDEQPERYAEWGTEENITEFGHCSVAKITVYPNKTYTSRVKSNEIINLFIAEGQATFIAEGVEKHYAANDNLFCKSNSLFSLLNRFDEDLVLVCTKTTTDKCERSEKQEECFVKLSPSFRDTIWGGTRICNLFGKHSVYGRVAESWELSAYPEHESVVSGGTFDGLKLSEYFEKIGKDNLGWKCGTYNRFPLMIKLIDATQNLSIQVHPSDEYAFPMEGDFGKNEMWYILSAEPDSCIYVGFNRDITSDEVQQRIADNTLIDVLNVVPVKSGETYFLGAGTVHAIGAGCLVCEVQQSSNVTYRLYDFDRVDASGKKRELQIEKALDVIDFNKTDVTAFKKYPEESERGCTKTILGQCKYFTVTKLDITEHLKIPYDEASFNAVVVIEGDCMVGNGKKSIHSLPGDTWFFGCKENIEINGSCTVLVVNI